MERKQIVPDLNLFPQPLRPLLSGAPVFDSSCSEAARVYHIQRDGGLYLKTAPKGTLRKEADMTAFFHSKGLSAEVLSYESLEADWLLTRALSGEDCTHPSVMEDPKRLSALLGELLRQLHETDGSGCPEPDRIKSYINTARRNYEAGQYDLGFLPIPNATLSDAWAMVQANGPYLKNDTLLHGDYCLPNVMLDNWVFSGFIDLDNGGMGDRHIDLYWGVWTLNFNLHTHRYGDRFLDAYGRDKINPDVLPVIGAFEVFG